MGKPFTMAVTLSIDPARRDEYLAALRDVLEPARNESTNVFLYPHFSEEEPNKVVLFERWLDKDVYFDEVLKTDHYVRYLTATESMYSAPRDVRMLDPVEFE